jgi:tripartite ATP-independent transporter DctP family solute receptor
MMMLKKFRCLVLAMVLILVIVSCTVFAADKPIKLIYGHVQSTEHFFSKEDRYFKKLVEKNSKGQILIDFFPAGQLGGSSQMIQATISGAQQMTEVSTGDMSRIWPKMSLFSLPYLYRDDNHQEKVMKRLSFLIGEEEFEAKTGLHILNVRRRSPRHLNTKFPVNKLEDIKGLKIRVPENPIILALWKALGTVPTVIPTNDVYTALATGTVDAQENPFDSIWNWKYYEQAKYCALTAHGRETRMTVINDKYWKSLTAGQRKIIANAANKIAKMAMKDVKETESKYYDSLVKVGMKFTKPNLAPFRERAQTIWSQFGDAKLIQKIQAVK